MQRLREFLFKWRGGIVAPLALAFLVAATPTLESLAGGFFLALLGESVRLWAIGFTGEPTRSQSLDAPVLVTSGPYGLIRNPLYLGNLLNGMAVATAAVGAMPAWRAAVMWFGALAFLLFVYGQIIVLEEEFLAKEFGIEYQEYRDTVPALLPMTWKVSSSSGLKQGSFSLSRALTFEKMTLLWQVLIWLFLVAKVVFSNG